uniref:Archaic translocase of outer membrane 12 kDa subunit n=1 Tax=Trypanosoma congolense (strain IL3000) TaxID=1068625 RepID=G0US28_TRYCI|nr:conserved hypothetical protein [Trypanosoma congolense IL3000]
MSNIAAKDESAWIKVWNLTKAYGKRVASVYSSFIFPAGLILAYNVAMFTQDTERFGLAWMHYSGMEDEEERERKFPAYEPGSVPQRKRLAAAGTKEYAAAAV